MKNEETIKRMRKNYALNRMKHEDVKIGDKVIYIPKHLLMGPKTEMVKESNIGVVTSKNDKYVFVRYKDNTGSQATNADDLFTLRERPDLAELV